MTRSAAILVVGLLLSGCCASKIAYDAGKLETQVISGSLFFTGDQLPRSAIQTEGSEEQQSGNNGHWVSKAAYPSLKPCRFLGWVFLAVSAISLIVAMGGNWRIWACACWVFAFIAGFAGVHLLTSLDCRAKDVLVETIVIPELKFGNVEMQI